MSALLLALALAAAVPAADSAADGPPLALRETRVLAGAGGDSAVAEPAGLAVDAFGQVWVSDATLHRVARFDSTGAWRGGAGALGSGDGELRRPGTLAALGTLSVAVLDRENRRVQAIDLFGRWLGTRVDLAAPALTDEVGRIDALDLAADRGGALYVADGDRDRVLVFDAHGRYQAALGGFGPRPGSFRGLRGVALAPRGELVTTERTGARVQRLDAGGRALSSWPLSVRPGMAALPVAVDDADRVAVADEAGGTLWVFDDAGRLLATAGGLAAPRALAFAPDGALLVAESRGRVRRFVLEPRAREE